MPEFQVGDYVKLRGGKVEEEDFELFGFKINDVLRIRGIDYAEDGLLLDYYLLETFDSQIDVGVYYADDDVLCDFLASDILRATPAELAKHRIQNA